MWHREEDQETGARLRPQKQEAGGDNDKMAALGFLLFWTTEGSECLIRGNQGSIKVQSSSEKEVYLEKAMRVCLCTAGFVLGFVVFGLDHIHESLVVSDFQLGWWQAGAGISWHAVSSYS